MIVVEQTYNPRGIGISRPACTATPQERMLVLRPKDGILPTTRSRHRGWFRQCWKGMSVTLRLSVRSVSLLPQINLSRTKGQMQRPRSSSVLCYVCLMLNSVMAGTTIAFSQTITRPQVEARLPALEALARHTVDAGEVPGLAIAVVFGNEVIFLSEFGLREVGKPEVASIGGPGVASGG